METSPRKRTQKDYSLSFKLQVVKELELGQLTRVQVLEKYGIQAGSTVRNWLKKYGNFDYNYTVNQLNKMSKTPEQRILELEQELLLSKKEQSRLEHELKQTDKKVILFDMMIDIAEQELAISIRKKSDPKLLQNIQKNIKKA